MSDDSTRTGGQENKIVDTSENHEMRDWGDLMAAVKAVGNNAVNVDRHLKSER